MSIIPEVELSKRKPSRLFFYVHNLDDARGLYDHSNERIQIVMAEVCKAINFRSENFEVVFANLIEKCGEWISAFDLPVSDPRVVLLTKGENAVTRQLAEGLSVVEPFFEQPLGKAVKAKFGFVTTPIMVYVVANDNDFEKQTNGFRSETFTIYAGAMMTGNVTTAEEFLLPIVFGQSLGWNRPGYRPSVMRVERDVWHETAHMLTVMALAGKILHLPIPSEAIVSGSLAIDACLSFPAWEGLADVFAQSVAHLDLDRDKDLAISQLECGESEQIEVLDYEHGRVIGNVPAAINELMLGTLLRVLLGEKIENLKYDANSASNAAQIFLLDKLWGKGASTSKSEKTGEILKREFVNLDPWWEEKLLLIKNFSAEWLKRYLASIKDDKLKEYLIKTWVTMGKNYDLFGDDSYRNPQLRKKHLENGK